MKKVVRRGMLLALSVVMGASFAGDLHTQQDKVSYAIGFQTGKALTQHNIKISPPVFVTGFKDALGNKKPQLSQKDMQAAIMAMQKQAMAKMQQKAQQLGAANMKASDAFLAANKSKAGVKTTASGLQYKVLTAGTGPMPTKQDTVTVDYEGKLANGKVFDSSYKRGKPVSFPVGGVIKGWQEALQMMKVGATWELYIPPAIAYGAQGAPGSIGPNQVLIFKVHLISIKSAKKAGK